MLHNEFNKFELVVFSSFATTEQVRKSSLTKIKYKTCASYDFTLVRVYSFTITNILLLCLALANVMEFY